VRPCFVFVQSVLLLVVSTLAAVEHKITNMNVKWYTEWSDENGDGINDGYVQLALEFVLCIMIAYAVYCEVMETLGEIYEEKSIYRGLALHFMSFWNYLDAINLALQVRTTTQMTS
jgi:hypothetical protein